MLIAIRAPQIDADGLNHTFIQAYDDLAASAFRSGLVDECHLFIAPVVVGGGNQALPDRVRLELELRDERRFSGGMVHLRYRVR